MYMYDSLLLLPLSPDEVYHSDFHRDSDNEGEGEEEEEGEETDNDYSLADSGYSGTGSSPLSRESRYVWWAGLRVGAGQDDYSHMYM